MVNVSGAFDFFYRYIYCLLYVYLDWTMRGLKIAKQEPGAIHTTVDRISAPRKVLDLTSHMRSRGSSHILRPGHEISS